MTTMMDKIVFAANAANVCFVPVGVLLSYKSVRLTLRLLKGQESETKDYTVDKAIMFSATLILVLCVSVSSAFTFFLSFS